MNMPTFQNATQMDQIAKIHNVVGTPPPELLSKMKKRSAHVEFNFGTQEGTGIEKLIPHASPDAIDLINKLLAYNPDDRLSARQALRHPYFRELREQEKKQQALVLPELSMSMVPGANASGAPRSRDSERSFRRSEHEKSNDEPSGGLPSLKGAMGSKEDAGLPMLQVTSNRIAQHLQAESSDTDHDYESGNNLPPLGQGRQQPAAAAAAAARKAQAPGGYPGYGGYRAGGQAGGGVGAAKHGAPSKGATGVNKKPGAGGHVSTLGPALSGQAAGTMKWKLNAGKGQGQGPSNSKAPAQFGVFPQRSVPHLG